MLISSSDVSKKKNKPTETHVSNWLLAYRSFLMCLQEISLFIFLRWSNAFVCLHTRQMDISAAEIDYMYLRYQFQSRFSLSEARWKRKTESSTGSVIYWHCSRSPPTASTQSKRSGTRGSWACYIKKRASLSRLHYRRWNNQPSNIIWKEWNDLFLIEWIHNSDSFKAKPDLLFRLHTF